MNTTTKLVMILALGGALVACGDDDVTTGTDAGPGVDSGPGFDGGPGVDSGGEDAGMPMALGRDSPPPLGAQIDRAGRAATSTAGIGSFFPVADDADPSRGDLKDIFNGLAWNDEVPAAGVENVLANIAVYDGIDLTCGNQLLADTEETDATRYATLATVLADDRLIVDSSQGTCEQYLGVEAAAVLDAVDGPTGGCGGRTPTVDVISRSYSILVGGDFGNADLGTVVDALDAFDDGLSRPLTDTVTHNNDTFPFLAAPE